MLVKRDIVLYFPQEKYWLFKLIVSRKLNIQSVNCFLEKDPQTYGISSALGAAIFVTKVQVTLFHAQGINDNKCFRYYCLIFRGVGGGGGARQFAFCVKVTTANVACK